MSVPGSHPGGSGLVTVGTAWAGGLATEFRNPCSCPHPASDRDPVWGSPHRMHVRTHTRTHINVIQCGGSWGQSFILEPPAG